MSTSFSIRTMIIGLLLVALLVAGRLAFYFYGNAVEAGEQVREQKKNAGAAVRTNLNPARARQE